MPDTVTIMPTLAPLGERAFKEGHKVSRAPKPTIKAALFGLLDSASGKVVASGTATTIFSGITFDAWIAIVGLVLSATGVLITYYFQKKKNEREDEQARAEEARHQADERRREERHKAELALQRAEAKEIYLKSKIKELALKKLEESLKHETQ